MFIRSSRTARLLPVLLILAALMLLLPDSLVVAGGRPPKYPVATATPDLGSVTDAKQPGKPTRPPRRTATPTATSISTATPTATASPTVTSTSTPAPPATPTPTETLTSTSTPTATATPTPTSTPTAFPTAVPGQQQMAVAYQVNPAHDGSQQAGGPTLPLAPRWSVNFGLAVSYPLIARGKVFVTVRNGNVYGTKLHALDAATGAPAWGPIDLGGTYFWSGIAYDDGRVFAVNFDGLVRAFDADTGQLLWERDLDQQYAFSSPPTALQGVVYVGGAGSGGTLFALDAGTGVLLWTQQVANGDHSSPALSEDGVFVSYACARTYKFDRWTGSGLWDVYNGCSGGGGRTPVYFDGRLYVRDDGSISPGYIFDADTGEQVGSFAQGPAPAFANGLGYFLTPNGLAALDTTTYGLIWHSPVDGTLSTAPLVVGSVVYVGGTSGNLYGLDAATGQLLWSDQLPAGIPAPDEHNVSQPLTGLNAGEGLLVVPAGNLLVAYGAQDPTPTPASP